MQSSHHSGESQGNINRRSAINISGLRIMQNDCSTTQINLYEGAEDGDEFDDGDTVFQASGHQNFEKKHLRSKSQ
jgi:nicotinate-nucleotide pyrophosphorylase